METRTAMTGRDTATAQELVGKAIVEVNLPEGDWVCGYVVTEVLECHGDVAKELGCPKDGLICLKGEEIECRHFIKPGDVEFLLDGGSLGISRYSEVYLMDADRFRKEEGQICHRWDELLGKFQGKVMHVSEMCYDDANGENVDDYETVIECARFAPMPKPGFFPEKLELCAKAGIIGQFDYVEAQDLLRGATLFRHWGAGTWLRLLPLDINQVADALIGMKLVFGDDPKFMYTVQHWDIVEEDGKVTIELRTRKGADLPIHAMTYTEALEWVSKDIDDGKEK